MEYGNELGQIKVDDWKMEASKIKSTVKGVEDTARRVYSHKVGLKIPDSYFSSTPARSILQLELLEMQIRILEKQEIGRLEALKETETKKAIIAVAKNKQNSDVPKENDSEDITIEAFNLVEELKKLKKLRKSKLKKKVHENVAEEHEVQTEKEENLPKCIDCEMLSNYKNG